MEEIEYYNSGSLVIYNSARNNGNVLYELGALEVAPGHPENIIDIHGDSALRARIVNHKGNKKVIVEQITRGSLGKFSTLTVCIFDYGSDFIIK